MKTRNSTHFYLSLIATLFLLFAICLQVFAQTITVDKSVQYQTIEGFGGFGPKKVWWDSGPYYDAEYLNQTIDNLGVNIFRTQIYWDGEQSNDDSNPNTFNWAGFNFGPTSDNGKQFPFISALAAKGSKIIGTVWTPPLWMKLFTDSTRIPSQCYNCNNCAIGSPARKPCGGSLNPIYYSEFAEYLVAYVKTLKQQTGVDLYGISIQNEPWFANPFEATVVKPAEYADILKIVAQRFEAEGLTTKFFGPEHMAEWSWGIQTQYVNKILNDSTVKPYLDIYAVHSYVDGVTPDYGSAAGWTNLYNNITVAHGKSRRAQERLVDRPLQERRIRNALRSKRSRARSRDARPAIETATFTRARSRLRQRTRRRLVRASGTPRDGRGFFRGSDRGSEETLRTSSRSRLRER